MTDLFCLAFLLTANADKAEECVIRSVRECMKCGRILKDGLPAWVRNSIIRNGVALVNESEALASKSKSDSSIPLIPPSSQASIGAGDYSAGILELNSFERLVYVICILENYSSRHCALLLRTSREEVREARIRALAGIAEFETRWRETPIHTAPEARQELRDARFESETSCGSLLD